MLAWFLLFSTSMEVLEGAVALLTAYYALKFYRLVREDKLLKLFLAFLSMGLGLVVHGIMAGGVLISLARLRPALAFLTLRGSSYALFTCEAAGYILLSLTYARLPREEEGGAEGPEGSAALLLATAAAARPVRPELLVVLMRPPPVLEGIALALLIYLSARTTSNFLSRKEVNPFLVCFSFLFLTAARACFLLSFALAALYITGHVIQLLAFLSFLLLVLRVMRS